MKRWIVALVATVLACLPILINHANSPGLLRDTDTSVLLRALKTRNSPLSWFTGDWPLANHFYRPVSTLTFELDSRLYGSNAAGYGLTNAIICTLSVLILFWMLRELTDRPVIAGSAAVLFAFQHYGLQYDLLSPIYFVALATILIGIYRHRQRIRMWLPAVLTLIYSMSEVAGMDANGSGTIGAGTLGWLPGRTATVMTVFALASMAAYARYERLGTQRKQANSSPLDKPATKSAVWPTKTSSLVVIWPILSMLCVGLALGSYEQAVMLPACLLAIGVTMHFSGFRIRWGWQAGFWGILIGYLVLRHAVIPEGASSYQLQQFRSGPGVWQTLFSYAAPFVNQLISFWATIDQGAMLLLTVGPYSIVLVIASNLTAFYQCRRRWVLALAGFGMSFIAILPMAWVKTFPHYNYWPMALRSLFVVTLLWVAIELVVTAWSPQSHQAPLRHDPAPGSLPHP